MHERRSVRTEGVYDLFEWVKSDSKRVTFRETPRIDKTIFNGNTFDIDQVLPRGCWTTLLEAMRSNEWIFARRPATSARRSPRYRYIEDDDPMINPINQESAAGASRVRAARA